jgi:hypothetical protein
MINLKGMSNYDVNNDSKSNLQSKIESEDNSKLKLKNTITEESKFEES